MITIDEYKKQEKQFTAKPFNIRGNPDNKASLTKFTDENGFKNEGLALDYIFTVFEHVTSPEQFAIRQQVHSQWETRLDNARIEKEAAQSEVTRLQSLVTELQNKNAALLEISSSNGDTMLANMHTFQEFKAEVEKALPILFAKVYPQLKDIASVPVMDKDLLAMMVDYCQRDETGQFPYRGVSEIIVKLFLNNTNAEETQAPQPETNAATTNTTAGTESGTGDTAENGTGSDNPDS